MTMLRFFHDNVVSGGFMTMLSCNVGTILKDGYYFEVGQGLFVFYHMGFSSSTGQYQRKILLASYSCCRVVRVFSYSGDSSIFWGDEAKTGTILVRCCYEVTTVMLQKRVFVLENCSMA